jgi:hypothetical protein
MADGSHTSVNLPGQASDTYQEIRDALDSLMGDLKNVEGGLTCVTLRETETRNEHLERDFVSALYCLRDLLTTLYERGDQLVSRMMELERATQAHGQTANKTVRS